MLADEFDDKTARRTMNFSSEKYNPTTAAADSNRSGNYINQTSISRDGPSSSEAHKDEGFLKRAWHNLTHQHDDMPKDDDDQKKASGSG